MCNQCKQKQLIPELEHLLAQEFGEGSFADRQANRKNAYAKRYRPVTGRMIPLLPVPDEDYELEAPGYLTSASEKQIIISAIRAGERNENMLSNKVFFQRHPELHNQPLYEGQRNFSLLSTEWLSIRNELVRPLLGGPVTPSTGQPPVISNPGSGKITLDRILTAMRNKGYLIFTKPYELNIVGVRSSIRQVDSFDDSINIIYMDDYNKWNFRNYGATVDPGRTYLINPINGRAATAILKPGQYINSHKRGMHRGSYLALVQSGDLTVYRDGDHNTRLDLLPGSEETGKFGINIHRASPSGTPTKVGTYSAGCQVIQSSENFNELIRLSEVHEKRYGNAFTYTLLDEADLPAPKADSKNGYVGIPASSPGTPANIRAWPMRLVEYAMAECKRWGNGTKKETDIEMRPVLTQYWQQGLGVKNPDINLEWCHAFINYIVRKATGGSDTFKYGPNTTFTCQAIQNRKENNSNPFKAYRITEIKPEVGDILLSNQKDTVPRFTYDNVLPDKSGTHVEVVSMVNPGNLECISGNYSASVKKYSLNNIRNSAGYINDSLYFAIIRIRP